MRGRCIRIGLLVLLSLLGTLSCVLHEPAYNLPTAAKRGRPVVASQTDSFVWVAFSGGGTRAAAMAWKTLEVLKTIPFTVERNGAMVTSNLADEIDYVSGISGGCFAAAAWSLFRDDPEKLASFRTNFVEADIESALLRELLWPPWHMLWLASPQYDRINLASEFYHREIFGKATFAQLPRRPALRIHATDMALGTRFTFGEDAFGQIDSELANYPLGFACAASSAFPILMSPMTLMNHGETKPLERLKESDPGYRLALLNQRRDPLADFRRIAREHYNEKTNRYVHLVDGGIVDNQGLEAILEEYQTGGVISKRLADTRPPLRRLVLINVNAGVNPDEGYAKSARAPGLAAVMEHTMVASMDILSAKRWMRIKEFSQQLYKPVIDAKKGGAIVASLSRLERPYTIEVSFRNLVDLEVKQECNDLPTSFVLDTKQLELIDRVVPQLIAEDPEMKRLRKSVETGL